MVLSIWNLPSQTNKTVLSSLSSDFGKTGLVHPNISPTDLGFS